jgi:hypothetical protein
MHKHKRLGITLLGLSVLLVGAGLGMWQALRGRNQAAQIADGSGAQLLYCPQRVIDLGQLYRPVTEQYHLQYRIENRSDGDLNLRVIKRTCACAEAKLTRSAVPPGEATELLVTWDVPNAVGVADVRVYVADEAVEDAVIHVSGVVETKDVVRAVPHELDLGEVRPHHAAKTELSIYASAGEQLSPDLDISLLDSKSAIQAEVVKRAGASMLVAVSTEGNGSGEKMATDLVIHTGEKVQPEIIIPVRVKHLPFFSPLPPLLTFDAMCTEKQLRLLTIQSNVSGRPVKISRVELDEPSCFSVAPEPSTGACQRLSVQLLRTPAAHTGVMRVYLESQSDPVIVNYLCLGVGPSLTEREAQRGLQEPGVPTGSDRMSGY